MGSLVGIWAWGAWCAFFALHLLLLFLWRRTRLGVTLQSTLSRGGSTDEGPEPWGDDCLDSLQLNQFTLRFKSKAVERNYLDLHTRGNMTLAVFVFSYSVPMAAMVAVGFFDDYSQLSHLVISALIAVCAAAYVILTSYQVHRVMSVLVAGLLIALSVTETYEALRSLSSMGVGIHSEISLGMFFTGCMLLLFSQLFPWRWAALSVGLAFISTLVVWIEQGACWEWFCGTNFVAAAPWLINRVFIIAICVILSYQIEREARQRYTVQQKLKYLCFKISEMDLDACQELLQDSATWDSMKMERQLLGLVQTLQRYKPFLPQGIFQELSQNGDSVVTVPEATALDMPIPYPSQPVQNPGQKMASDDEEVRLSGTPVHEPDDAFLMPPRRERRTSNVNLLTALDRRKGTLLECSLDVAPGDTLNQAREFLELVEKAAAGTLGVVHAFGVGKATVTWNLFRHHPLHQAQACACALQVQAQQPDCRLVLVSAMFNAGILGTDGMKAPVLDGPAFEISTRLTKLHSVLGCPVLLTEGVYEAVQNKFGAISLDNVWVEDQDTSLKVYGLVQSSPLQAQHAKVYKQAFSYLLQSQFMEARQGFMDCMQASGCPPRLKAQATRLLRIAVGRVVDPRPFIRYDRGWEDDAGTIDFADDISLSESRGSKNNVPLHVSLDSHSEMATLIRHETANILAKQIKSYRAATGTGRRSAASSLPTSRSSQPSVSFQPNSSLSMSQSVEQTQRFSSTNGQNWYRSDHLLGEGGFGAVHLGMDEQGMLVAIKSIPVAQTKASELLNEIRVLSKFRHDNIVAYFGSALLNNTVVIVMEFMPCGSLARVLEQFKQFPVSSVRRYMRDILRGLKYLHSKQVLHRDIKPGNVLLEQTGQCKLADFGTAAFVQCGPEADAEAPDMIVGTPHYMAPEVVRGEAGTAGDVWATGVMCQQLLTGHLVFENTNNIAVLYALAVMTEPPEIPEGLSEDVQEFLGAALRLDPRERATTEELLCMPFLL